MRSPTCLLNFAFFLAVPVHFSCSSNLPNGFVKEIQERPLQGIINDEDWVLGSGAARPIEDGGVNVLLYADLSSEPCFLQSDLNKILAELPSQAGVVELEMNTQTVQLVETVPDESPINYLAVNGVIEVYSVTDDIVSAGMAVYANETTWVNGKFDIEMCF